MALSIEHQIEAVTHEKALTNFAFVHRKIHEGLFFSLSHLFGNINNDANADTLILTANIMVHVAFGAAAGGDVETRLYEAPTVTLNGTEQTANNRLRDSTAVPGARFFFTPTLADLGTLIDEILIPGGRGPNSAGAREQRGAEWVLKRNSYYLLRITNIAGVAKPVGLEMDVYEEDE